MTKFFEVNATKQNHIVSNALLSKSINDSLLLWVKYYFCQREARKENCNLRLFGRWSLFIEGLMMHFWWYQKVYCFWKTGHIFTAKPFDVIFDKTKMKQNCQICSFEFGCDFTWNELWKVQKSFNFEAVCFV